MRQSALEKFKLVDERIGLKVFTFNQNNRLSKIILETLSLSGDEAIWFGVSAALGCLSFIIRGFGTLRRMGCIEEGLWDCFGTCTACVTVESIIKVLIQRPRPPYAKQSTWCSCYGEWFSCPSGHTLRAFYALFWFSKSRFVKLLEPAVMIPNPMYLIPWAIGVGVSRVGKGKHYPLDVAFGAIIGCLLGYIVEDRMNGFERAMMKTVSGIYVVANWAYLVVIPLVNGRDTKGAEGKKILTGVLFYTFAISLLFSTLAPSYEHAGAQTIFSDGNGESCKVLW